MDDDATFSETGILPTFRIPKHSPPHGVKRDPTTEYGILPLLLCSTESRSGVVLSCLILSLSGQSHYSVLLMFVLDGA